MILGSVPDMDKRSVTKALRTFSYDLTILIPFIAEVL